MQLVESAGQTEEGLLEVYLYQTPELAKQTHRIGEDRWLVVRGVEPTMVPFLC